MWLRQSARSLTPDQTAGSDGRTRPISRQRRATTFHLPSAFSGRAIRFGANPADERAGLVARPDPSADPALHSTRGSSRGSAVARFRFISSTVDNRAIQSPSSTGGVATGDRTGRTPDRGAPGRDVQTGLAAAPAAPAAEGRRQMTGAQVGIHSQSGAVPLSSAGPDGWPAESPADGSTDQPICSSVRPGLNGVRDGVAGTLGTINGRDSSDGRSASFSDFAAVSPHQRGWLAVAPPRSDRPKAAPPWVPDMAARRPMSRSPDSDSPRRRPLPDSRDTLEGHPRARLTVPPLQVASPLHPVPVASAPTSPVADSAAGRSASPPCTRFFTTTFPRPTRRRTMTDGSGFRFASSALPVSTLEGSDLATGMPGSVSGSPRSPGSISPTTGHLDTAGWPIRTHFRADAPLPGRIAVSDVADTARPDRSGIDADGRHMRHLKASDAAQVLALMQQTGGLCDGHLLIRQPPDRSWMTARCWIDADAGSLLATPSDRPRPTEDGNRTVLVPDLRGCQIGTLLDEPTQSIYMQIIPRTGGQTIHIRTDSQDGYHRWFAAMLCWPPLPPRGRQNMAIKQQAATIVEAGVSGRRRSDGTTGQSGPTTEVSTIKIGTMDYLDPTSSAADPAIGFRGGSVFGRLQVVRSQAYVPPTWIHVSCMLRENGELKILSENSVVAVVQLSQLSRSAIQCVDVSVLDREYCVAIYPQFATAAGIRTFDRPIYLAITPRVHYEAWVVLLRAFAVPQLYGPKLTEPAPEGDLQQAILDRLFRMDRMLAVRINGLHLMAILNQLYPEQGLYFAEVQLNGEVRARTSMIEHGSIFQTALFEFSDVPDTTTVLSFVLKKRTFATAAPPARDKDPRRLFDALSFTTSSTAVSSPFGPAAKARSGAAGAGAGAGKGGGPAAAVDTVVGHCDVYLVDDLEAPATDNPDIGRKVPVAVQHRADKTWPVVSAKGQVVARLNAVLTSDETVMLMSRHYVDLSALLHDFNNRLTNDLADLLPVELRRLSMCLLNLFQVTNLAKDWILSLVEEELDDYDEDVSPGLYGRSDVLGERDPDLRQISVRNQGKTATVEANLLFRGNTLLTKTLDLHMNRLGREYLEEVLGAKIRDMIELCPDFELDPSRLDVTGSEGESVLKHNRRRLLDFTEDLWASIEKSGPVCPVQLREIFRRISSFAQERYGRFQPSVKYISVSGFLFLRFFVPAVLNPRLFGLVRDEPSVQARRNLTLVGKSIQGLANMTPFGSKESWMEPMNEFVNRNRENFKRFIEHICSVPATTFHTPSLEPRYQTPLTIMNRLPPELAEGFPSLPYLIDPVKPMSMLAALWLENADAVRPKIDDDQDAVKRFDKLCCDLATRTQVCMDEAERADRPGHTQAFECGDLIRQLEQLEPASVRTGAPISDSTPPTHLPAAHGLVSNLGSSSASRSGAHSTRFGLGDSAGLLASPARTATGRPAPILGPFGDRQFNIFTTQTCRPTARTSRRPSDSTYGLGAAPADAPLSRPVFTETDDGAATPSRPLDLSGLGIVPSSSMVRPAVSGREMNEQYSSTTGPGSDSEGTTALPQLGQSEPAPHSDWLRWKREKKEPKRKDKDRDDGRLWLSDDGGTAYATGPFYQAGSASTGSGAGTGSSGPSALGLLSDLGMVDRGRSGASTGPVSSSSSYLSFVPTLKKKKRDKDKDR